jgi:hypothetical protein
MIGKIIVSNGFTGCISYCLGDKKIRNTLAFEFSVQRIRGVPAMLFLNFQLLLILSLFIYKTLQNSSNYKARNRHLSSKLYKPLQFSSRMFDFISKALKKAENTWVRAENFNAIERGELKYLAAQMQQLTNDIKNYLQQ